MSYQKTANNAIGLLTEWTARVVSLISIILIGEISYDVMMRYIFNAPTNWSYDTSSMLLAVLLSFGFGYTQYHRNHVRVDVFYNKFTPRMRNVVDILFTVFFFIPLFGMLAYTFVRDAVFAYQIKEVAKLTFWFPITWPYKSLVAVGFCLFLLQGMYTFVHDVIRLAKGGTQL